MQDLQKLTDKLALLEDLLIQSNEEEADESSLQGLMNNPTIGQMYRACRDELPKLLELANSELNEDLMIKIISITERLTQIKSVVEGVNKTTIKSTANSNHFELKQSSDDIKNIFDDLPLLPTKQPNFKSEIIKKSVKQESFQFNNDILLDLISLNSDFDDQQQQFVLRIMNISKETLNNLKLVKHSSLFFRANHFICRMERFVNKNLILSKHLQKFYNQNNQFLLCLWNTMMMEVNFKFYKKTRGMKLGLKIFY